MADILVKHNFLCPDDFHLLVNSISEAKPYLIQSESYYNRRLCKIPTEVRNKLVFLISDCFKEIPRLRYGEVSLKLEFMRLAKYSEGCYFGPHVDTVRRQDKTAFNFRILSFSLIIQQAARGGLMKIEDQLIPLSPNSLVIFPSHLTHEITKIEEGERIVAFGFFRTPKDLKESE